MGGYGYIPAFSSCEGRYFEGSSSGSGKAISMEIELDSLANKEAEWGRIDSPCSSKVDVSQHVAAVPSFSSRNYCCISTTMAVALCRFDNCLGAGRS